MSHKRISHKSVLISLLLILCVFYAQPTLGEGHRQQKAHVHGIAHLNLVMTDNELYIEFESPAADIVGFEHEPRNEEEKAALQKAFGILRAGKRMFTFSQDADVQLQKSVVKTVLHHDCEHDHDEHEQNGQGQHSDILIEYQFYSKAPNKLKSIDVKLFKRFKSLQKIRVQALTPTRQIALELTPQNTEIRF